MPYRILSIEANESSDDEMSLALKGIPKGSIHSVAVLGNYLIVVYWVDTN